MNTFIFPLILPIILFFLGFIAGRLTKSYEKIGKFVINVDDPKKPAFWLELNCDLDVVEGQAAVLLDILHHSSSDSSTFDEKQL